MFLSEYSEREGKKQGRYDTIIYESWCFKNPAYHRYANEIYSHELEIVADYFLIFATFDNSLDVLGEKKRTE